MAEIPGSRKKSGDNRRKLAKMNEVQTSDGLKGPDDYIENELRLKNTGGE